MRRRLLPALLLAALPLPAAAQATPEGLALARDYVAQHRGTLPDLRGLVLGAAGDGSGTEAAALRAAIDAELTTAEPAYREAMAAALAEGLSQEALRSALADGSIRAAIRASPNAARLIGTLNRLTFEAVTGMAERALQRGCPSGEACDRR
jgi:2-hydroxychromene-2-carboxylate isomerase